MELRKLTPREIEVLTEEFDGTAPDWRDLTPAQRNGRRRVLDGLRGWNIKMSCIDRKGEITLRGLEALEPHYSDMAKIAAAINARRNLEDEMEEAERRAKQEREEMRLRMIEARKAKLIAGYRRILSDHHLDVAGKPDDLILSVGDAIVNFEGTV